MFLYFFLVLCLLFSTVLIQLLTSLFRKKISERKQVQYLHSLDRKNSAQLQSSSTEMFFTKVENLIDVGVFRKWKQTLHERFILPKDFSIFNVLASTAGLQFIAWNIAGFLKKPAVPFMISAIAIELGLLFFLLSRRRFITHFDKSFPQLIESLSRVYSAHPDLKEALVFTHRIMKDDASQKFLTEVNAMVRVGVLPTDALEIMAKQWQYEPLFHLVAAIRLHQQFGGNLAELLSNKSSSLKRNAQSRSAIKAALFQNKISAIVICILVPAVFLLSFGLSENYRAIIINEKTAKTLVLFAGIWWSIGILVMWRTLRFKL